MSIIDLTALKARPLDELVAMARDRRIDNASSLSRQQLIFEILRLDGTEVSGAGVLEVLPDGFGFLRDPGANFLPGADDIYVSPSQIRRFNLRTGDLVAGRVRPPKDNERYFALIKVEALNGKDPEHARDKALFDNLLPVRPSVALPLGHEPDDLVCRLIDMARPLHKGQRALLLGGPRTGKTQILTRIAQAITARHPSMLVIFLMVDERPEDVTEARRAVGPKVELLASTFDEAPARHVQVVDMALDRARRLVEGGADVVILLDNLSRFARAANSVAAPSGRLLAGGLDIAALQRPRRLLAAARQLEGSADGGLGGSLTVVAALTTPSSSRTDEAVAEELRPHANLEIEVQRSAGGEPLIDVGEEQGGLDAALERLRSEVRRPPALDKKAKASK